MSANANTHSGDYPPHPTRRPLVNILGVGIDPVSMDDLLAQFSQWISDDNRTCHQICTVNPEFVMDARSNPAFAAVLRHADYRVADGTGIVLAAALQGHALPGRVTGSDGIYRVCERAAEEGWRVFFLGAAPGVAQRTADRLKERYPTLQIAGAYAGSPQRRDWHLVHDRIVQARPDILLVAYGHPQQDFWIGQHREELPVAVAMGVGGAFDFVAGVTVRAPAWMRKLGMEWLHRLLQEPWRWRRMSRLPLFAWLACKQAISARLRSS